MLLAMGNELTGREAEEFGERLRLAREGAGMSLEKLAAKAGCSKQVISKWENGQVTRPDYITLRKICSALKVEPGAVLKVKD